MKNRRRFAFYFLSFGLLILLTDLIGKAEFFKNKYQTVSVRLMLEIKLPDETNQNPESSQNTNGLGNSGNEGENKEESGNGAGEQNQESAPGGDLRSGNQSGTKVSGIKGEELSRAARQEQEEKEGKSKIREITAYTKLGTATLRETGLNRTVRVGCYRVYGNMERVFPVSLLEGSFCYGEDPSGCVLDKNTAYDLFGTKYAAGTMLTYQGIRYEIRGIADTDIPFFMIQGAGKKETYDNLEFVVDNIGMAGEEVKEFLSVYHLGEQEEYLCIEGSFLSDWVRRVTLLPLWIYGAILMFRLVGKEKQRMGKWRDRKKTAPEIFRLLSQLLAFAAVCFLVKASIDRGVLPNPFYLPQRFLPTRFSDLSFWTDKVREAKEWYQALLYLTPYPKEIILLQCLRSWVIESIGAYVLLLFCVYFMRKENRR